MMTSDHHLGLQEEGSWQELLDESYSDLFAVSEQVNDQVWYFCSYLR